MAVILDYTTMDGALSMRDVIDLLEVALTHEAAGKTDVSQKYITDFGSDSKKLVEWISRNNLDFDKAFDLFRNQVVARIKDSFERYESLGIKCRILSWPVDMVDIFKDSPYLSKRFIQLRYRDQTYDCIDDLIADNKGMLITDDENNLRVFRDDSHPSLECHRIIASSIIVNLEGDI